MRSPCMLLISSLSACNRDTSTESLGGGGLVLGVRGVVLVHSEVAA